MKYESNILKRLIDTYGVVGNPRYISEIIKEFIVQGKERFPNLFTYQADWLAHIDEFGLNTSYTVSYTGQSIYAPNTLERPVKSAILKGQTIVNLLNFNSITSNGSKEGDTITTSANGSTSAWLGTKIYLSRAIERGKKYIVMWNNLEYTHSHANGKMGVIQVLTSNTSTNRDLKLGQTDNDDKNYMIFSCNDDNGDLNKVKIAIQANTWETEEANNTTIVKGLKVLEYQDGIENWDMPYFEGMQSITMPVLTTTGKNLFNNNYTIGKFINEMGIDSDGANTQCALTEFMPIKGGANVKLSNSITLHGVMIFEYDANKKILAKTWADQLRKTKDNTRYYRYSATLIGSGSSSEEALNMMMMEYGTQATPYEPFKSNILTVNEDVTLRSNGSVCDELDLLTGKLTQRIDEDGEVLTQEVVKTVELNILDQNGQNIKQLMSFSGGTHFNTGSAEGSPLPVVSVSVETDLEETLRVCSLEGNTL